jgi:adenosyl cobinamide kinase/adenosyl cobinamide phosphate guanylyltransferase
VITLVLGGARSGKSVVAERLAEGHAGPIVYLATARLEGDDPDLAERVEQHRRRRSDRMTTVEAADDLVGALVAAGEQTVLLDGLGLWLASQLVGPDDAEPSSDPAPSDDPDDPADQGGPGAGLVDALLARPGPTVVVSDEVGLGVHPETAVGRQFRDQLGLLNQQVAAVADAVLLVVAGRVLPLARLDELLDPP